MSCLYKVEALCQINSLSLHKVCRCPTEESVYTGLCETSNACVGCLGYDIFKTETACRYKRMSLSYNTKGYCIDTEMKEESKYAPSVHESLCIIYFKYFLVCFCWHICCLCLQFWKIWSMLSSDCLNDQTNKQVVPSVVVLMFYALANCNMAADITLCIMAQCHKIKLGDIHMCRLVCLYGHGHILHRCVWITIVSIVTAQGMAWWRTGGVGVGWGNSASVQVVPPVADDAVCPPLSLLVSVSPGGSAGVAAGTGYVWPGQLCSVYGLSVGEEEACLMVEVPPSSESDCMAVCR